MMNRREMLRTMGLVAAGVVAADQLEILDRLAPRSLFASAKIPNDVYGMPFMQQFRDQHGREFRSAIEVARTQSIVPVDGDMWSSSGDIWVLFGGQAHKVTLT